MLLVLLAACSSSSEPTGVEALPFCADLIGEPMPHDATCRMDEDSIAGTAHLDCDDGRVLTWNDGVIGFDGEPARAFGSALQTSLTKVCNGT